MMKQMNVMWVAGSILLVYTALFFFELKTENRNGKGILISLFAALVSFFFILLPSLYFFALLFVVHSFYPQAISTVNVDDLAGVSLAVSAGLHLSEITIEKLIETRLKTKRQSLSSLYLYRTFFAWALFGLFSYLFLGKSWDPNALLAICGLYSLIGYGFMRMREREDTISSNL